ncbi:MAG: type II secretion system F family protein [Armatimonadetes bacterium]|nr:type II secretion system F family protein [Armatimonadota bacterium]
MPTFSYVARTQAGETHRGETEAEDERVLRQRLQAQGYVPTEVKQVKAKRGGKAAAKTDGRGPAAQQQEKKKPLISFGKVKAKDLAIFCRQFSTMMNAGVSLIRCLTVLEQQTQSYKLKECIRDLQAQVEAGESLSKAMQRHTKVFNNLFIGLVRAGEVGGVLDETLERLAGFLERDQELRRKIKSAMSYPTMVMIAAMGIVLFLVTFVLPKFIQLFKDLGVEDFPPMTAFLISVSNFAVQWVIKRFYITWPIIFGFITLFKKWKSTRSGKRIYDWCRLRVPVFGKLTHMISVGRFARTLATLLGSGVPVLSALETTAGTVDNEIISSAILDARTAIREGEEIAKPLGNSGLFPPMVVQMVSIGEETGALDQMLGKVADFYEGEVEAMLDTLTSALEPLLIVFLGSVVGFIVIAMFMPLVKIIESLSA